jgi:WS/DGAT/MGAT family acyltransferase
MVTRIAAKIPASQGEETPGGRLGHAGERMSHVDTAWLRMDSPSNLMMIVGVWVTGQRIGYSELRERLQDRLPKFARFTQLVVEDNTGATWLDDTDFDISNHLVCETLHVTGRAQEQQALQHRLGELCMEPLDRRRPLWQFHLVEDYKGGSAILVRIHHCIADGIALISVMHSLVDGGLAPPVRAPHTSHAEGMEAAQEWIANALVKPFTHMTVRALGAAGEGAARTLGMIMDPQKGMDAGMQGSANLGRMTVQVISDMASLALMADDSPTSLKGTPGTAKRVAWCPPLPLDEVKAVGKGLGCSVNDVLLCCVAGAIGEYLRSCGESTVGKEIRAMIPVNLRSLDEAYKLGNQFGLAPLVLPIGIDNPVERIYEVRRRMLALKGSTQPLLAFGLLAIAGLLLKPAQDALLALFSKKTTAVMTNVPGPQEKHKICGRTIEETLVWVPQSGHVGLGVSILSYGGGVQFGVVTDSTLCPEPQAIIERFAPEFASLCLLTLMLPWGASGRA